MFRKMICLVVAFALFFGVTVGAGDASATAATGTTDSIYTLRGLQVTAANTRTVGVPAVQPTAIRIVDMATTSTSKSIYQNERVFDY